MSSNHEPHNLEELLDRIEDAANDTDQVSSDGVLEEVGRRSFGPLLLVEGSITLAPVIGHIPGVPTIIGVLVLLTGVQLLFRHKHIWLPHWLLNRSVAQDKLCKSIGWMRRPARFVDRFLQPPLTRFTENTGAYVIALARIALALAMPAMEVAPFSANGAGAALSAFGLALIARDGLLALLALVFTAITFGAVVYGLL